MSEGKRYAVLHRFTDLSLLEGWDGLGMEMVAAADFDAKAAECERLRKAVHDLQLFVQDSRGLKIIADALSPTEGAGAALPDASDQPRNAQ